MKTLLFSIFCTASLSHSLADKMLPSCKNQLEDKKVTQLKNLVKENEDFKKFAKHSFPSESDKPEIEIYSCLDNTFRNSDYHVSKGNALGSVTNKTYLKSYKNLNFAGISCSISGENTFLFEITLENNQILYRPLFQLEGKKITLKNFEEGLLTHAFAKALNHPFLKNMTSIKHCQITFIYNPFQQTFTVSLYGMKDQKPVLTFYDFYSEYIFDKSGNLQKLKSEASDINPFLKNNNHPLKKLYALFLKQKPNRLQQCGLEVSSGRYKYRILAQTGDQKTYNASISFRCRNQKNCDSIQKLTAIIKNQDMQRPNWSTTDFANKECQK